MGINSAILGKINGAMKRADDKRLALKQPICGVKEWNDIPYLPGGNRYHLLDVYRPEWAADGDKLPVLIDIHGGGWFYGDKDLNKYYAMGLAEKGFTVVNISYRLIQDGGTFPNILKDVFSALDFTAKNIANYGGDTDNIYLTGDSAGGHLAALATAVLNDSEAKETLGINTDIKFNALCLTCPVVSIEKFIKLRIPFVKYFFTLFFGKDFRKHPFIGKATIKNNAIEKFPPTYLISADGDFLSGQTKSFAKELTDRGVTAELMYFKRDNQKNKLMHVYNILYPEWEESIAANDGMVAFFKRFLKKEKNDEI